tara:strand:+ start:7555 stop:7935 length:381 start_codon:yes stop_codon:yes gene_type:complete
MKDPDKVRTKNMTTETEGQNDINCICEDCVDHFCKCQFCIDRNAKELAHEIRQRNTRLKLHNMLAEWYESFDEAHERLLYLYAKGTPDGVPIADDLEQIARLENETVVMAKIIKSIQERPEQWEVI